MTLDESNSRLSVENYGLVRAAEDVMYFFFGSAPSFTADF